MSSILKKLKNSEDTYYYVDGEEICVHKGDSLIRLTIRELVALTRAMIRRPVRKYENKS